MKYIIILMLASSSVFAEKELFFDKVTPNLARGEIYNEIERVFLGRKWRVLGKDVDGVKARIYHRGVDATVQVFLENGSLYYTCEGTRKINVKVPAGGNGGTKKSEKTVEYCPKRWIANLQHDSAWVLQGL